MRRLLAAFLAVLLGSALSVTTATVTLAQDADIAHDGDNDSDVDQGGDSTAGNSIAGGQSTSVRSGGKTTIRATNNAEGSRAEVGDATVNNDVDRSSTGDSAPGGDIIHDGENDSEIDQSGDASVGDGLAGGQTIGVVAEDADIQASNTSEDARVDGGDATVNNSVGDALSGDSVALAGLSDIVDESVDGSEVVVDPEDLVVLGPIAFAGDALSTTTTVGGTIDHDGDDELDIEQDVSATAGDAVAGGQTIGAVVSDDLLIDASNDSEDSRANGGDATGENSIGTARAGDDASVIGGDATALSNANADLTVTDAGTVVALGGLAVGGSAIATTLAAGGTIDRDGDDELDLDQDIDVDTGDAVAGGQTVGGSAGGDADVTLSNRSVDDRARSGDADGTNTIGEAIAGDDASATAGTALAEANASAVTTVTDSGTVIAIGGSAVGGVADANATALGGRIDREGDDDLEIDQDINTDTGNALAGGQTVGLTAGGDLVLDATNDAEGARSRSGDATGENAIGSASAGDDTSAAAAAIALATADTSVVVEADLFGIALGGSVVVDDLGANGGDPEALAVAMGGTISRAGDDEIDADQDVSADTGDALAGGQTVGATAGGDAVIDLDNTSDGSRSRSGDATGENTAGELSAGDSTDADGSALADASAAANGLASGLVIGLGVGGSATGGGASATVAPLGGTAARDGDAEIELDQDVSSDTGDATSGAQVLGLDVDGDADVDADNRSTDDRSRSGDAEGTNSAPALLAGESASASGVADAVSTASATGEGFSLVIGIGGGGGNILTDGGATGGDVRSIVAGAGGVVDHVGDDEIDSDQDVSSDSGDAVSGGQVIGGTVRGTATVDARNTAEDARSRTGDAEGDNSIGTAAAGDRATFDGVALADVSADASAEAGALLIALAGGGEAVGGTALLVPTGVGGTILHDGDAEVDLGQDVSADTGDAVSGSQMSALSVGDGDLRFTNRSEDGRSSSGDADASNTIGSAAAGEDVGAASDMTGIATADASAEASALLIAVAIGGEATGGSVLPAGVAGGGAITHTGDDDVEIDQDADASTGDATSGGQILGASATGDLELAAHNTSEDDRSSTGNADADNSVGAVSVGDRSISEVALTADVDAVADATALAFLIGIAIPGIAVPGTALPILPGAAAPGTIVHIGDNELDVDQDADAEAGDATSGGQVVSADAAGDVELALTNDASGSTSSSGSANDTNALPSIVIGDLVLLV